MRLFLSLLFILVLFPQTVRAHILEKEETVGAVLHISPDDDPVVGEASNFFFEFKDTTNTFTPSNCDCQVTLSKGDTTLLEQPLFNNRQTASLTNATFSFTFPEKGNYTVKVSGRPLKNNSFTPFTLEYSIRVTREKVIKNMIHTWIESNTLYVATAILGLGVTILYIRQKNV